MTVFNKNFRNLLRSVDASSPMDQDIRKMMEDKFGPPDRAEDADPETGDADRTAWGLRKVEELSSAQHAPPTGSTTRWLFETPFEDEPPAERQNAGSVRAAVCFSCGASAPASSCSKCKVARYCTRECQVIPNPPP